MPRPWRRARIDGTRSELNVKSLPQAVQSPKACKYMEVFPFQAGSLLEAKRVHFHKRRKARTRQVAPTTGSAPILPDGLRRRASLKAVSLRGKTKEERQLRRSSRFLLVS
jgi:hypothetical protein